MRIWDRIKEYFTCYRERDALRDANERLRQEMDHAYQAQCSFKQKARDANQQYQELRAQLVQIRVSQSAVKRAGWEVMCFIPEECLISMRSQLNLTKLAEKAAVELLVLALGGIHRVRANGRCCALVFEPLNINAPARAPRFVQALWDHEGKFKLSEKCWDQRTEEQRVRGA